MKLKWKLAQVHKLLANGELVQRNPQLAQLLSWGLNFMLGLVLAAAPLLGGCGPFGVAITAQAGGQVAA